jgi:hypothetical protein
LVMAASRRLKIWLFTSGFLVLVVASSLVFSLRKDQLLEEHVGAIKMLGFATTAEELKSKVGGSKAKAEKYRELMAAYQASKGHLRLAQLETYRRNCKG